MKVDKNKLKLAMANACMNTSDLQKASNLPRPTLNGLISCREVRPATIGRVAKALGVDVAEIIEK